MHPAYSEIYHLDTIVLSPIEQPESVTTKFDLLSEMLAPFNDILHDMTTGERVQVLLGAIGLIILLSRGK